MVLATTRPRLPIYAVPWLAGATLVLLGWTEEVGAEEAVSKVQVLCEELDSERRAAIEARQLGELKTRGGAQGLLELSCAPTLVTGSWSVGGRKVAQRSLSRTPKEDPSELLHWLAAMLLETREERAQAGIDDVALAAGPLLPADLEKTETEQTATGPDEVQATEPEPDEIPPPPPPEAPPESPTRFTDSSPPPLPPTEQQTQNDQSNDSVRDQRLHLVAGASAKYQHWGSELTGSWGPALSAGVEAFEHSTIEGEFSPQFAVRRADDFGATEWTGTLRYCAAPLANLEGCIGGAYSHIALSRPSSLTGDDTTSRSLGGELLLRALLRSRTTKYFVGLGLRTLARDREVLLNEDEIARIPRLQMLFALGFRGRP